MSEECDGQEAGCRGENRSLKVDEQESGLPGRRA